MKLCYGTLPHFGCGIVSSQDSQSFGQPIGPVWPAALSQKVDCLDEHRRQRFVCHGRGS